MGEAAGGLEPAAALAGECDNLQRLWTPHRMAYIDSNQSAAGAGCPFCAVPQQPDEAGLVVARAKTCYVVLNLYPYNPGHVLVCPYRHIGDYTDLTDEEAHEMTDLGRQAMAALARVSSPAGFNLGVNQGRLAGAGVQDHCHLHVVPRWAGDANFFPIVAQTKAMPQLLSETRRLLAEAWDRP